MVGLVAALFAAGVLVRRAVDGEDAASDPSPVPASSGATHPPTAVGEEVVRLEEDGTHPGRLRLQTGTQLTLLIRNASTTEHHFIVGPLGIHEDLGPGSSAEVTVSDPRRGTYRSWCSSGDHPERITFVVA